MSFLLWGMAALVAGVMAGTAGFTGLARDGAGVAKMASGLFTVIALLLFGFAVMTLLFSNGSGDQTFL